MHYNSAASTAQALVTELTALGVKATAFQADLSSYDGARKLHAEVVAAMGHPDVLFNNSGTTYTKIGTFGNIQDMSPEEFEATWRTNTGTHYLVYTYIHVIFCAVLLDRKC